MAVNHGKVAYLYRQRPNNFVGDGLNDVTWGTGFNGASSKYFEVEIDAEGTPDTFKWRVNGGGYTTGVAITGAAQTLSDSQTITFAATTGHTLGDKWHIQNFKDEPCTESGNSAQITATGIALNHNNLPTFTDTGGETVIRIDPITRTAYFTGNVTTVTVDGNNGGVRFALLEKAGYMYNWDLTIGVDLDEITAQGDDWKDFIVDFGEHSGGAEGYFIAKHWFEMFEDCVDQSQEAFLLRLFEEDEADDLTGPSMYFWATLTGYNINAPVGVTVKDRVEFTGLRRPQDTIS